MPGTSLEDQSDLGDDSPETWARRWQAEFAAARKELEKWHTQGDKIIRRYRDERDAERVREVRWSLFWANVTLKAAMLMGQTPRSDVSRRWSDAGDDVARVGAELWDRLLNADIEQDEGYTESLKLDVMDMLLCGCCNARWRYVAEFQTQTTAAQVGPDGKELAAAVTQEVKTFEDVEIDYVHWKDQLWSPCRTFHEVRWWSFLALMTRAQLIQRFGEELGRRIPLNARKKRNRDGTEDVIADPWARAAVWEIWCKEDRRVYWYVEGFDECLDVKDDPLGLKNFWPFAKPIFRNLANDKLVPVPDFVLVQDLYDEIDLLSTRIQVLERCVKLKGGYDKANAGALERVFNDTDDAAPDYVPLESWNLIQEKGGLAGVMDTIPLAPVIQALGVLREIRSELIQALYQIEGTSDLMRGQTMGGGITATENAYKAKAGGIRMQPLQDEFARFATDLLRIKAEIIAKHFDAKTIFERSNAQFGFDANVAMQAIQLMQSRFNDYRMEVKPENVSLTDFAQLKQERVEFLGALSTFLTSAAPLAQAMPGSLPYLLQILQWTMAGLRGSSTIEGVLDQAIQKAQQQAQQQAMAAQQGQGQPPPDPKVAAMQMKGQLDAQKQQMDLQMIAAKTQADLTKIQAEAQASDFKEQSQAKWNVQEAAAKRSISQAGGQVLPFSPGGM